MANKSDTLSGTSEALLPGAGHTPSYGIVDYTREDTHHLDSTLTQSGKTSSLSKGAVATSKETVCVMARCALTACLASVVCGMTGGFSSPTLQELQSNTTIPAHQLTTTFLAKLFGALAPIGAIVGGLSAWPATELLGRQTALVLGGIPFLVGWLFIANAFQFAARGGFLSLLFIGRFLTGIGMGWSVFSVSVYNAEISSARWKGRFGICNQLLQTGGILLIYMMGINYGGHIFHYYNTALVAAGVVAVFEVGMLFTYETPRWLLSKDKDYQGIRVLKTLRGPNFHISAEISSIKAVFRQSYSIREQLQEFRRRAVFHPFVVVLFLMFFQQFSGINVAIFYSSEIFKDAGYSTNIVNLITFFAVGVVQVLATFVSVLLISSVGQRKLLVASSLGMLISSFLLGIYFYVFSHTCCNSLDHPSCPSNIKYMAIVCVVIFISSFSIGWGPIPWAAMSELLPNHVRSLGGSIATAANWGFATCITLLITSYMNKVTIEGTWWSFALVMLVSIFFVVLFVPETNGRTLEQIQAHFEEGKILVGCGSIARARRNIIEAAINTRDDDSSSDSRSLVT